MKIAVIINPVAGGPRPSAAARVQGAKDALARAGERGDIFLTERAGHARELAAAAARDDARLVIAWGGDGTLNEVASALAFGTVALGIVPAGSGNGLARELGVPTNVDRAFADALRATPRAIDAGEIEGRLFVNLAGMGFDAHIASRFARRGQHRGFLGYASLTAQLLASYAPLEYRITAEGETRVVRAVLVTLANSAQFGNGARIAPGARVDDGLLDLVVVEEASRLGTIAALPRLFSGTVARFRRCRIDQVTEVTVETDRPMTFHVDGEPLDGGTSLRARVHPGALLTAIK